jgi:hypothetical protein
VAPLGEKPPLLLRAGSVENRENVAVTPAALCGTCGDEIDTDIRRYLRNLASRTIPKAPLVQAISYTVTQWNTIVRVLDDGRFHLDENATSARCDQLL